MIRFTINLLFSLLIAQINLWSQPKFIGLSLESDPITTMLGARTLSMIIEPPNKDHWSFFGNIVSANFPNWMNDFLNPHNRGKGFETRIKLGGGFAIDYFIQPVRRGLYLGMLQLFFRNEVWRNQLSGKSTTHNIISRMGYRWFVFGSDRCYLNPFLGLRYEYRLGEPLVLEQQTFDAAKWQPFATVHIGFKF